MKLLLSVLLFTSSLMAYSYTTELYGGLVYNLKSDLTYKVSGEDDIVLKDADLRTKPFTPPPYYGIRVSIWDTDGSAWEIEHTHQKLYASDADLADVAPANTLQHWEMTDGFNFFYVNKAWKMDETMEGLILRVGTGLVITHPDIKYNGEQYRGQGNGAITMGEGYDLSGFVWQLSSQKTFDINKEWYFMLETKFTYAFAYAEDEMNGISEIQNKAFHFNYGVGYRW